MKKSSFSYQMLGLSLVSGAIFVYSLYGLDPRGGGVNVTIFLVSLFFAVSSIFALLNFIILRRRSNNEGHFSASRGALRRGLLLGFYLVGVLGLSALELLTWWDAVLLALSLVLFELYFISGKENVS